MDEVARKLSRRDSIKEIGFYSGKKVYFLLIKLTLAGSEFHRVGATTEKAQIAAFIFTQGI